jgi:hypothetical protein
MIGPSDLLVNGAVILVVRLRQIGRGSHQAEWVNGNGGGFADGWFDRPSGDYKSDCDYRDAEQSAHVRSPLSFRPDAGLASFRCFILQTCSTYTWYRANVASLSFCIVCIWLGENEYLCDVRLIIQKRGNLYEGIERSRR